MKARCQFRINKNMKDMIGVEMERCNKKIGERWNTIRRGSKICVKKDTKVAMMHGTDILPKGYYYISGFWGDAVGLNTERVITDENFERTYTRYAIPSKKLKDFYSC